MTTFPGSPKLVKGGMVLVDPETSAVLKVITLYYNSHSVRCRHAKNLASET